MGALSDEEKQQYIEKYVDNLSALPKKEYAQFKAFVEEGCGKEWICALHAMAYGCYGGNEIFPCDWVKSRDCLLKLVELTDGAFYYNTLGYIFYYGRCNNGKPEYDKAFQYFSVGAANGIYESRYKLADMYLAGKGCLKSQSAGVSLITSMFNENREIFCNGNFDGKFADIALRMGGLYENGIGVDKDLMEAYAFYCEALLAINKRMEDYDFYGDKKVKNSILEAIERVKPQLPEDFFEDAIIIDNPAMIGEMLKNSAGLDVTLDKKDDFYCLHVKSFSSEDATGLALLTVPEMGYCELVNEVTLYLSPETEILSDNSVPEKYFITAISYDAEEEVWKFSYRDMVELAFKTEGFLFAG